MENSISDHAEGPGSNACAVGCTNPPCVFIYLSQVSNKVTYILKGIGKQICSAKNIWFRSIYRLLHNKRYWEANFFIYKYTIHYLVGQKLGLKKHIYQFCRWPKQANTCFCEHTAGQSYLATLRLERAGVSRILDCATIQNCQKCQFFKATL